MVRVEFVLLQGCAVSINSGELVNTETELSFEFFTHSFLSPQLQIKPTRIETHLFPTLSLAFSFIFPQTKHVFFALRPHSLPLRHLHTLFNFRGRHSHAYQRLIRPRKPALDFLGS